MVGHTDDGEEEGRHQTVGEHLEDGTRDGGLRTHEQGEEHHATVGDGGVGVDVLQVGLHTGRERAIDHGDGREDEEDRTPELQGVGHEEHRDAQAAVATELHQHTSMEHGDGGRRGGVTVRAPCVEGEERSQHTETDEDKREEDVLDGLRHGVELSQVCHVHRLRTTEEVDAEDAEDEQGGTTHEHQGQFHGRILLRARTPHADEQVHRDEGDLVEHEHREHVGGDEEAEHTNAQQHEPKEVLLGERLQLPGGEGAREDDDRREEDHHHGDTIHADAIGDLERFEPRDAIGEQHVGGIATGALVDEIDSQPDGQRQQGGSTDNHHATHLIEVLGQPEAQEHQEGDYNE